MSGMFFEAQCRLLG